MGTFSKNLICVDFKIRKELTFISSVYNQLKFGIVVKKFPCI